MDQPQGPLDEDQGHYNYGTLGTCCSDFFRQITWLSILVFGEQQEIVDMNGGGIFMDCYILQVSSQWVCFFWERTSLL